MKQNEQEFLTQTILKTFNCGEIQQVEDEEGGEVIVLTRNPPAADLPPLVGYGDTVRVGDWVWVTNWTYPVRIHSYTLDERKFIDYDGSCWGVGNYKEARFKLVGWADLIDYATLTWEALQLAYDPEPVLGRKSKKQDWDRVGEILNDTPCGALNWKTRQRSVLANNLGYFDTVLWNTLDNRLQTMRLIQQWLVAKTG